MIVLLGIMIIALLFERKNILLMFWIFSYALYFGIHTQDNLHDITKFFIWISFLVGAFPLLRYRIKLEPHLNQKNNFLFYLTLLLYASLIPLNYIFRGNSHNRVASTKSVFELVLGQLDIALAALLIVLMIQLRKSGFMLILIITLLCANAIISGSKGAALQLLLTTSLIIYCCTEKSYIKRSFKTITLTSPVILFGFLQILYQRQPNLKSVGISTSTFDVLINVIFARFNFGPILDKVITSNIHFQHFSDFTNLKLIILGFLPSFLTERPEVNLGRYFARDIGLNETMLSYVAMSYPTEFYINFAFNGVLLIIVLHLSQRSFLHYFKNDTMKLVFLLYCPLFISFEMNIAAGITRQGKVIIASLLFLIFATLIFKILPKKAGT